MSFSQCLDLQGSNTRYYGNIGFQIYIHPENRYMGVCILSQAIFSRYSKMMWQGTFTIGIFWGMYIYRQRQLHTYSDPNLNSSSKKKDCLDFGH